MEKEEKHTIKVVGGTEEKQYIRENKHLILSTTGFSGMQMNFFVRALTKFDFKPEDIEDERRYLVEFQRSEVPLDGYKASKIAEELQALQDITIRSNSESGWSSLKPFPKVGEYNDGSGTIQIWFDGEYLKPILELKEKEGWAVILVAEMFSLQGRHAKKLFELFSSAKNKNQTRLEYEVDILKKILGIPDKYKNNPGLFMKKVVYPAVEQINKKTSIKVEVAKRNRKGKTPSMVIFDVKRKEKLTKSEKKEINKPGNSEQTDEQRRISKYFNEKQLKCYDILIDWGFTNQQAFNCANKKETMKLFFRWQYNNAIQAEIKAGRINKSEAKSNFFKELKANQLKI